MSISWLLFISSSFSLLFVLPAEVTLSTILFPIKSPLVSAVFLKTYSEEVIYSCFCCSIHYFFYHIYHQIFLQITKSHILQYTFFTFGSIEYLIFIMSIRLLESHQHYFQFQIACYFDQETILQWMKILYLLYLSLLMNEAIY